jgi:Mg-chelatase subunit ChlD
MKRFLLLVTGLVLLAGCDRVQRVIDEFTPSDAVVNGYTVERDAAGNPTGNVALNVSALDSAGEPIAGRLSNPRATVTSVTPLPSLAAAQRYTATATITVDITVQEVISAVLNMDRSGSMRLNDPERLRVDAAKRFLERITSEDRVAVMEFPGQSPGFRASTLLQNFTSDKALLEAALDKVGQRGNTPIWDALLDTLDLHAADEGGRGASRVVLLFTDGEREGGEVDFTEALAAALESDVRVFAIGLGAAIDTAELQKLAAETGGTFSNVQDADQLEDLFNRAFNAIRASGTITLSISPVPPPGSLVRGTLSFTVNGEDFSVDYAFTI